MVPHDELDGTTMLRHVGTRLPRVLKPADENDVLREQLEYLISHATEQDFYGCTEGQRFLRVRSALLEIFESGPVPQQVVPLTADLPMAA